MIELVSTPTKITGVHYVQGVIIFHDVFDNEHNVGGAQIRVEGVYIWPFRQLRMVANSGKEGEQSQEDDYLLSNPYHLLGVFSSQVFQESPRDKIWRRKHCILVFFTLNLFQCCIYVFCPCCSYVLVILILAYCSTNLSNGETL
jgi:hypothetical protein